MVSSAKVVLSQLSKTYESDKGPVWAVSNVDMEVSAGEFATIIGPSGCGKSTLFNIIAGLVSPTSGHILIDGIDRRNTKGIVGYMLQKDLLLPWRTVLDNVILGLEIAGQNRQRAYERALPVLRQYGLAGFEHHYPGSLSGGMRQRVALIRTLLYDREILLFDEPFGALDAQTRLLMQEWLVQIWSQFSKTILFVTHDIEEAIFLSDRIYVMTARPGHMRTCIEVPLPRPRMVEMMTSPPFIELKRELLGLLHEEALKGFRAEAQRGETGEEEVQAG